MEKVNQVLLQIVDFVWGLPLVFLLTGGGLFLFAYSGFVPLTGFAHAFKLIFGKFHHKNEEQGQGQITHFKALSNALASTIGLGNISGVAIALTQGGPGAIFWMWVSALIGMNTKFFECSLALLYRGKDYEGEVQGGPMYYITQGMGKKWTPLAYMFTICGLVGTYALFQANQLASFVEGQYQFPRAYLGVIVALLVFYILKGGLQRLAQVTSFLVPTMCLSYLLFCLLIIVMNLSKVPTVFAQIFTEAFTGKAATGGVLGYGFIHVLVTGVKRGAFSNESGIGTAPMAHSNARTPEPISEGLVAMMGPFLDTIIVCTMTALVLMLSIGDLSSTNETGIMLTTKAFEQALPGIGTVFLGICLFLFSFSTLVGSANYNSKCWNFLFKGRSIFGKNLFIATYCLSIVFGAAVTVDIAINLLDIAFALMAIPNMIAVLFLAPKVKVAMKDYFAEYVRYQ